MALKTPSFHTSPGNHQAWVAVSDAPDEDFARRPPRRNASSRSRINRHSLSRSRTPVQCETEANLRRIRRTVKTRARITADGMGIALCLLALVAPIWAQTEKVGSAKDALMICGSGYFLIEHNDGSMSCLDRLPPRNQADCPPKSTFGVVAGGGRCSLNINSPDYVAALHAGDPPPAAPCEHDSDCPTSYCGSADLCAPTPNEKR